MWTGWERGGENEEESVNWDWNRFHLPNDESEPNTRDELQLFRNFLIQHILCCKITARPELQMACRTLNFDADDWKLGLGCFAPRGAQLSVFSLVPAHLAKDFFEFFWNHFESLSEILKKKKRKKKRKTSSVESILFPHKKKGRCESDPEHQLFPERGGAPFLTDFLSSSPAGSCFLGDERFNQASLGNIKSSRDGTSPFSPDFWSWSKDLAWSNVLCAHPQPSSLGKFWMCGSQPRLLPLAVTRASDLAGEMLFSLRAELLQAECRSGGGVVGI